MLAMNTIPDFAGLLADAQAGSTSAWGVLLEQYRPYLLLLAQMQLGKRLQTKADQADLVQETFLRAIEGRSGFRGQTEKELAAWLRSILADRLKKLTRQYLGTSKRDLQRETNIEDELANSSHNLDGALLAASASPSSQAAHREEGILLARLLHQLPEHYREVIVRHNLQGDSFAAIATVLGRTENSVLAIWARAMKKMQQLRAEMA